MLRLLYEIVTPNFENPNEYLVEYIVAVTLKYRSWLYCIDGGRNRGVGFIRHG